MSERTRDGDVVLSYLNRIGLKPSRTLRQFWADLERRHGKSTVSQLQIGVGERSAGHGDSLYAVKNRDLSLSLDFAAYSADLYRRFFDWWVARRQHSPRGVMDLGCDNGIVTCFLALLHPDAHVVGVDVESNAIRCAESLADRLGLQNVTFQVADLSSPDWLAGLTHPFDNFDTLVTIRSLHELLADDTPTLMEGPPHFSTRSLIDALMDQADRASNGWPSHSTSALLSQLVHLMANQAEWVSFDRFTTMKSVTSCAYLFHTVGLDVDWDQARWIPFHEVGEAQSMPILVYRKRANDVKSPAPVDPQTLQAGVYQLFAPELSGGGVGRIADGSASGGVGGSVAFSPGQIHKDDGAEVLFERLADPTLLVGHHVMFPNQSETRIELYECNNLLFVYQRTASGYRQLDVHALNARQELLHHFTQTMPNTFTAQGTSFERY